MTKFEKEVKRISGCFWNRECPECGSKLIQDGDYCEKCEQEFETSIWMHLIDIAIDNFGEE